MKQSISVSEKYTPLLQDQLGKIKAPYNVKLHPDAKPFGVRYSRRVPIPLLPKVHQELERMNKLGAVERVEHSA